MPPKRRRESDAKHTDEDKGDSAREDNSVTSDSAAFIEPAPNDPNDTPLDKERERTR